MSSDITRGARDRPRASREDEEGGGPNCGVGVELIAERAATTDAPGGRR